MRRPGDFAAKIGDHHFAHRDAFERVARAMDRPLRPGAEIAFVHEGRLVIGQVWDSAPHGWWVVGDDRATYRVTRRYFGGTARTTVREVWTP